MRSMRVWSAVFLVVVTLIGCRSPEVAPEEGAPEETLVFTSPLATTMESAVPTATIPPETVIPTPGPGMGVVVGLVEIEDVGRPMSGVPVYLGEPIGSSSGAPLFGLDPSRAPHVEADAQGRFIITDVAPGEYVVILWGPVNSIMARDTETGEPLRISVEPGDVLDIGILREPQP